MKTELKVKLLQHLSGKKKEQGFTLIELLVVIIIIGILSAIALPSFLNQSAKARASEARTNVGAMNRAQQAYYLENQKFAVGDKAIENLSIGIKETDNYKYAATAIGADNKGVVNTAEAKNEDLKGYAGAVFKEGDSTRAILCEAEKAGKGAAGTPENADSCKGSDKKLS
jgi:type IV pilus assembly protein PilA